MVLIVSIVLAGFGYYNMINAQSEPEEVIEIDKTTYVDLKDWIATKAVEAIDLRKKKLEEEKFTIFLAGDVMLSRDVGQKMVEKKNYNYPFEKMKPYIDGADIAMANLESPIIAGKRVHSSSYLFRADPESAVGLNWAGFDVLSLANNHILNQGQEGLAKTWQYLDEQEIDYCGTVDAGKDLSDSIVIRQVKNTKIAFLCYSYGPKNYSANAKRAGLVLMDEEQLAEDMKLANELADFAIVSMHTGVEYEHESAPWQQNFARAAIDNGADVVVGHHPHVVQEFEEYKDKYIFYSLGNFVFDQMWSKKTRQGMSVRLTVQQNKVVDLEYLPIMIEDFAQPRLADEDEKAEILAHLDDKS